MTAGQLTDGRLIVRPAASPVARRWAMPLDPAVVIAGCIVFAAVMFLPAVLNDSDTLWQIRTGDWILNHLAIPHVDSFSYTAAGRPWVPLEWVSEILLALAFRAAGMKGVIILTAAVAGLTASLLMRHMRRFLPGPYAVMGLLLVAYNVEPSLLARPHLLAWPCLILWCIGLTDARTRRTTPSFALLPVMVLWANLHGSFILGLLLPGCFLLEALLEPGADHRQVLLGWGSFIVAAFAVALLNPDFLKGVLFPFHLVQMPGLAFIVEWQPMNFSAITPLEVTILGAVAAGLSGAIRLPPIRLLMLVGLMHEALAHARNDQLLGLAGAVILAEPIGTCLARGNAATLGVAWRRVAAAACVLVVAVFAARITLPLSPRRTGAAFDKILDQVPPSLRAQPVLNQYGLGGTLIFHRIKPFIDGRADLYGSPFMDRYEKIVAPNRAALNSALAEYHIAWTIFPEKAPVIQVLEQEPGWQRLVKGDGLVIDVRKDQLPH